jgi:RhtB (resistance to homoserine/threonine) family protein
MIIKILMDTFLPLITIIGIHLAAVISPGPNFFISAKHGLSYSRPAGLSTTAGVATGTLIHITLGFLGLSALIAQSIWLYTLLKYAGAIYLIYLGVKALRAKRERSDWSGLQAEQSLAMSPERAYGIGLATCLTNPKAALYFFALFTTVISANTPLTIKVTLVVLLPLISWLWYSLVALSFSLQPFKQWYNSIYGWVEIVFGLLLIGLGAKIALSSR